MQTSLTSTVKPLNPCTVCKQRHLKCDSDRPCSNCRKSDTDCVRGYSVRFRYASIRSGKAPESTKRGDYQFAQDQPWVRTNRTLSFVDETPEVINTHDSGTGTNNFDSLDNPDLVLDADTRSHNSSPFAQPSPSVLNDKPGSEPEKLEKPDLDAASPPLVAESGRPHKKRALSHSAFTSWRATPRSEPSQGRTPSRGSHSLADENGIFNPFAHSPAGLLSVPSEVGTPGVDIPGLSGPSPIGDCVEAISGIYLETPRWPLTEPTEAMLFQNYINQLAPLFDLCDSDRHFATVVPRRAVVCTPLMNAVLAASAKRLSRISDFDPLVGDRYHQNCLDALIPALSSSAAVMDENLLTAIVILRFMEELDIPSMSAEIASESHLVGTRVFIAAQDKLRDFTSLRRSAFWVALRQEIHMAFIQTRPVHPNFDLESISRLVVPDDNGCSFANLTILHCASCVRYCYGVEEQSVAIWEQLRETQDRWWAERPWFFFPMYNNENNGVFPEVVHLNDAVITGVMHYYLVQILLAAHNPKTPKLGPGQAKGFRETNEEIKKNVRMVCGVAESNSRNVTCFAYVCLAITMAGDRFTDPHEQEALYNLLIKSDTKYAWPTGSTQQYLREVWGWADSPPNNSMTITHILNNSTQAV